MFKQETAVQKYVGIPVRLEVLPTDFLGIAKEKNSWRYRQLFSLI